MSTPLWGYVCQIKINNMKIRNHYLGILLLSFIFFSCSNNKKEQLNNTKLESNFTYNKVSGAEFPKLNIAGFHFPEDSSRINQWIHSGKNDSLYLHSWGIWTGITSKTTQFISSDSKALRVFETWLTPEEMIDSIKGLPIKRSNRANLKMPHQFTHFLSEEQSVNDSIHESVAYSPGAADFAIKNKIFMATTLYNLGKLEQKKEIPFFPANTITIKPVFKLLPTSNGQTLFKIASWNGTIQELRAYPESAWSTSVTVDITNINREEGSIFGINNFIHYKLNDEDAYFFNKEFSENEQNKFNAKAGDIAILVGMHVSTREITNWTWQTFWWTPDANNPPSPSSKAIAKMRPKELKGAPEHYAMAVAYYMVNPNEPYDGTNVLGRANYAFNPYLEAGFGPNVFDKSLSYISTSTTQKLPTYAGVRTNCMSCHRMASVDPNSLYKVNNSNTPYVGNAYISHSDTIFKNQLLTDFAWSVQANVDTTGITEFIKKSK
ncbi:MAG: hypothetical protein ACJAZ3_000788 [Sphingobacteriales bacterium]|jgi:hypothetical protein